MGLLDDAIREHLELKRRRGADSNEVERQEHEALGPPIHGEFAAPAGDAPAEPPAAVAAGPVDEPEPEPEPDPVPEPEADADSHPEPADPEGWLDESPEATREFTPEEAPAAQEEPAGEDVLEETPEFLQETPEHERLWFEQKPPRDFDLDH